LVIPRKTKGKKEAFRRGEEGFFLFRGLSWSQAENERGFTVDLGRAGVGHAAG
jgi:hypothetical protein